MTLHEDCRKAGLAIAPLTPNWRGFRTISFPILTFRPKSEIVSAVASRNTDDRGLTNCAPPLRLAIGEPFSACTGGGHICISSRDIYAVA